MNVNNCMVYLLIKQQYMPTVVPSALGFHIVIIEVVIIPATLNLQIAICDM